MSEGQQDPPINSIACITLNAQHSLAQRTLYLIEGGREGRGGGALAAQWSKLTLKNARKPLVTKGGLPY